MPQRHDRALMPLAHLQCLKLFLERTSTSPRSQRKFAYQAPDPRIAFARFFHSWACPLTRCCPDTCPPRRSFSGRCQRRSCHRQFPPPTLPPPSSQCPAGSAIAPGDTYLARLLFFEYYYEFYEFLRSVKMFSQASCCEFLQNAFSKEIWNIILRGKKSIFLI